MLKLFRLFLRLGFFAFGGGYSLIAILEQEVVEREGLIDRKTYMEVLSISEGLPGPIVLNIGTFIGYLTYRVKGACAALFASVVSSFLMMTTTMIMLIHILQYEPVEKAMCAVRAVVLALIVFTVGKLAKHAFHHWSDVAAMIGAFVLAVQFIWLPLFWSSVG
jgi:chromate transporter